jgi:hypothetical protein
MSEHGRALDVQRTTWQSERERPFLRCQGCSRRVGPAEAQVSRRALGTVKCHACREKARGTAEGELR